MGPTQRASFKIFLILLAVINGAAWAAYYALGLTKPVATVLAYLLILDFAVVMIFAFLGFITAYSMAFRLASFKASIERVMKRYNIPERH